MATTVDMPKKKYLKRTSQSSQTFIIIFDIIQDFADTTLMNQSLIEVKALALAILSSKSSQTKYWSPLALFRVEYKMLVNKFSLNASCEHKKENKLTVSTYIKFSQIYEVRDIW